MSLDELSLLIKMTKKRNHQPDPLFRESIGRINPLKQDKIRPDSPRPDATARQRKLDNEQVLLDMLSDDYLSTDCQPGDILSYHQQGVQPRTLKKLRTGSFRIDAECDLHGLITSEAKQVLSAFFLEAEKENWRCLKVIHGKGNRSSNQGPVLKGLVDAYLRQRNFVLAFHSAPPADGGTGAVYVLLKNQQKLR